MIDKKCKECKMIKNKTFFFKFSLCNKCKIVSDINLHLLYAKLANHFNTSIKEIENILEIDMDDPSRNDIGEHQKYDDVMLELVKYSNSQFNNKEAITRYLDETNDI